MSPTTHRVPSSARVVACAVVAALITAAFVSVVADRISAWRHPADRHPYLGGDGWPSVGQGAYRLGDADPHSSPDEQPVSIASVAKVMTAYQVLLDHPLAAGQDGPTLTVTAADVTDTARRRSEDQSVVDVDYGERLTERQALEALLVPSGNNIARMLAVWSAGSLSRFVDEMNGSAVRLGMSRTSYTDPSGFDDATSSTAADQLALATAAARQRCWPASWRCRACRCRSGARCTTPTRCWAATASSE